MKPIAADEGYSDPALWREALTLNRSRTRRRDMHHAPHSCVTSAGRLFDHETAAGAFSRDREHEPDGIMTGKD